MSSELVRKLNRERINLIRIRQQRPTEYDAGFLDGFSYTLYLIEQYEAQQMKEPLDKSSKAALEQAKDIYLRSKANWELVIYGIDKHSHAKKSHVISRLAEWAIEQEKLEEEK